MGVEWVTGVITLLIGVIAPFLTGRGPTLDGVDGVWNSYCEVLGRPSASEAEPKAASPGGRRLEPWQQKKGGSERCVMSKAIYVSCTWHVCCWVFDHIVENKYSIYIYIYTQVFSDKSCWWSQGVLAFLLEVTPSAWPAESYRVLRPRVGWLVWLQRLAWLSSDLAGYHLHTSICRIAGYPNRCGHQ